MNSVTEYIGFYRSRLIYDFKPGIQRKMVAVYRQFIREGDLCFDIGAHTGSKTEAFLTLGATVIAMEPNPLFAQLIKRKFSKKRRVILSTDAIGSEKGMATLMVSMKYPSISTLSHEWKDIMRGYQSSLKWEKNQPVRVTTLDELISRHGVPSFCKIDVEGFEEEALAGLSTPLRALSFEFFPTTPERSVGCIERLASQGTYLFNWSVTESYQFQSKEWIPANLMKERILNYRNRKSGDIYAVLQHS
jgi:FkbM family methyltransferase